jgi:pimeloyl-ACP methyl ester carboxylesterase
MISQLVASENIDPLRVYVVGFSIGGYATYRSACQLSNQVAAIAAVSQVMAPLANQPCNVTRPVSELEIAGSNDLFPIHQTAASFVSADQTATIWRSLNGCSAQSTSSQVGPTTQTTWSSCDDGSSVAEYVVNGGTHVWPGPGTAGADAQYDAAQAVWSFLSVHRSSAVTTAEAKLVSLHVRGGHQRKVQAVIRVMESSVQVQVTLTAHGHAVTSKKFTLLQGTRAGLTLPVPSHARQSPATVKFAFLDSYGRRLTVVRSIRIPSLPK